MISLVPSESWGGFKWVRASARNLGAGLCPLGAFGRAAASPQTRQMRCWPSSERTTNPASRRKRQNSLSLSLVLFPPKPLRWVSAGALLGEVIRLPLCIFDISVWGVSLTLRLLWLCRNNPARGLFQQKKRLSQSGCSAPTDTLFPPAHSAFSAFQHGGGITTLGARFMPLKRWTPAGHGGVFAVFMPPQYLPCVG